jgi:hypothetical protein
MTASETNVIPVALPSPEQVVSTLLGFAGMADARLVDWQRALTWEAGLSGGGGRPWPMDLWVWLPVGGVDTREAGHYYLNMGMGRIWDAWAGAWCRSGWVPNKNSPRVSVKVGDAIAWVQLGKLLAATAESPLAREGANPSELWALALPKDQAGMLQRHEVAHGAGSGCFNIYSFRWTRRGHPSEASPKYPYRPLPQYIVRPDRGA